jgi:hypothetical protein
LRAIAWLSALLPTYFLFGIYNVAAHDWHGHSAYLLGRYSDRGWWWYFPAAFVLKTALPCLLVALGGLGWGLWARSGGAVAPRGCSSRPACSTWR